MASLGMSTFMSMDCSMDDTQPGEAVPRVFAQMIVNCLVPVFLVVGVLLVFVVKRIVVQRTKVDNDYFFGPAFITSLVVSVVFVWPSVSRDILSIFDCVSVDVSAASLSDYAYATGATITGSFLRADVSVQCWDSNHLALVLGPGIPGLMFFCLGTPVGITF